MEDRGESITFADNLFIIIIYKLVPQEEGTSLIERTGELWTRWNLKWHALHATSPSHKPSATLAQSNLAPKFK